MSRPGFLAAAVSVAALGWAAQGCAQTSDLSGGPDQVSAAPYCLPSSDQAVGYPRNAHPGQCFVRVHRPPVYQNFTEQVEIAPARREARITPAVYAWAERQEIVEPERIERHVTPPTYRSMTETVVVRPASVREDYIPPTYDTVMDQVVVSPPHTEWRRSLIGPDGVLPPEARIEATGEVLCLVEVPAEYATVPRRVMTTPAHTVEVPIPAVTQTVTRQVIDQPSQVIETVIPAVYRTVRFQRLVSPEQREIVEIPAVFAARERRREVRPGDWEWRQVICANRSARPAP